MDEDAAGIGAVIAVEAAQEGGLAGARRADEGDAFTGVHGQGDVVQDGQAEAAAQMEGEVLVQVFDFQHFGHACSTEETRSWV